MGLSSLLQGQLFLSMSMLPLWFPDPNLCIFSLSPHDLDGSHFTSPKFITVIIAGREKKTVKLHINPPNISLNGTMSASELYLNGSKSLLLQHF
jgi:hypothetical protein